MKKWWLSYWPVCSCSDNTNRQKSPSFFQ